MVCFAEKFSKRNGLVFLFFLLSLLSGCNSAWSPDGKQVVAFSPISDRTGGILFLYGLEDKQVSILSRNTYSTIKMKFIEDGKKIIAF